MRKLLAVSLALALAGCVKATPFEPEMCPAVVIDPGAALPGPVAHDSIRACPPAQKWGR